MSRNVKLAVAAAATLVLLVAAIWGGIAWRRGADPAVGPQPEAALAEVMLTPIKTSAAGIDPGTGFTLTAQQPLQRAALQAGLSLQPAAEFRVEQLDTEGKQFMLLPAQPLVANRIYRVRLGPAAGVSRAYQWSFQTLAEFRVLGSLPRHQSMGVPVTTGIELTFTHEQYGDIAAHFTISPQVKGRFEQHKRTVAFVPQEPLAPGTIYTVTLTPGLGLTGTDKQLTEPFTFAFETQAQEESKGGAGAYFHVPSEMAEFPAKEAPYFQVYYSKGGQTGLPEVAVNAYRYPDADTFVAGMRKVEAVPYWASYTRGQVMESTANLTRVASFKTALKSFPDHYSPYLLFPEPLAPGYYLAEAEVEGQVRQIRFQVSDLSSYLSVTSTDTLVWLHDMATGAPVAGATVRASGDAATAMTGADGVATLPTPQATRTEPVGLYLTASAGGKEAVLTAPASYYGYESEQASSRYWRYLYLDRALYKPEDTINIWGVALPREPGAAAIERVTAELIRQDYRYWDQQVVPLASVELPVVDGTFTGAVSLPSVKPGYYELRLRGGEMHLQSRWFEVQTYTKPAYRLEVASDKQALFAGEPVTFRVKATFFEGTPVPNLPLNWQVSWSDYASGKAVTDEAGELSITYTPPLGKGYGRYWPDRLWFSVSAALPEEGEIAASATAQLFTRNVAPVTRVDAGGGQATIRTQVNLIDIQPLNAGTSMSYIGAPAPGREVRVRVVEENWKRFDNGETYDFINKVVIKQYRYEPDHREIASFTMTTGADGLVTRSIPAAADKAHRVSVQVLDTNGNWVDDEVYFYGGRYTGAPGNQSYRWYQLALPKGAPDKLGVGGEFAVTLQEGEAAVADRERSFLFYTARFGLQGHTVQDSATYRYRMQPEDVPNTHLRAVYFDGRQYRTADRLLRFDEEKRQLTVSVTPHLAAYRPGEEVRLAVEVKDRQGRPVRAKVNLNLVDEALYALREQQVNLLTSLYGDWVPSGILRTRSSHNLPQPGFGAEKGGEGDGVRKDFKDAVFFETVTTDSSGQAEASFRLPDNLTTWRLTWQALAPGSMEAASGTVPVPVKLPFFVEMGLGERYLTGDQPGLLLRGYGEGITAADQVRFTVTVTGPGGLNQEQEVRAAAFEPAVLPLPKLQAGTYTVRVKGEAGAFTDTLERSFTVVDTFLRATKVDFQLLSEQTRLAGAAKGITTLTFTDYERGRYLQLLHRLSWQGGNRVEQKLARTLAPSMLVEHFGQERDLAAPEWDPLQYQAPDGSVAILPYADGDLVLTALMADLAADRFDRSALAFYFYQIMEDRGVGRERAVVALYGLAALEQPVLSQIQGLLTVQDLTLAEQLYLALGLAELGDLESARTVYQGVLKAHGEPLGANVRIKAGRDQDEILAQTALAGVLAAKLGEPQAAGFAGYLLENGSEEQLFLLEQLLMAEAAVPQLPAEPVAFTYLLDGKEERRELKPYEVLKLPVEASQLAGLRFKAVSGKVAVTAAYDGPLDLAAVKQESGFALSRTYRVNGTAVAAQALKAGDLVEVTITYTIPDTAPAGGYEVTDYLPAGLRLVQSPFRYGDKSEVRRYLSWPLEVDGQRLTFWASPKGDPVRYFARVASPGEFLAEPAVLLHTQSGTLYRMSERAQVRIAW